ncbi:hypothetical protein [Caballeronia sp. LZ035]|uniref:hypothetical protein n=1 Tax=Caballeronia sp. LZ035 TaxID=3038568 RepID=UPI00285EB249|nr:hypothetical protein [Caballeronia sp. LZ035]MDR5762985.1 hypothetical protein [Caballeronia sp. LZ035]
MTDNQVNQRHLQSASPSGQEQCVSGSTAEQASPCEVDMEVAYELAGLLDMISRGDCTTSSGGTTSHE